MFDPKYDLVENDKQVKNSRRGTQAGILAGALTLTLVLGAFYAPVLWQSDSVSASPARQCSTSALPRSESLPARPPVITRSRRSRS